MEKHYRFHLKGTAAEGVPWESSGEVFCELHQVLNAAMVKTFQDLTNGKALYGHPGVGCKGPYEIQEIKVEKTHGKTH
jgi:hypothetical protein